MVALHLGHADGGMVGVAPAQVEREAQHLELAERVDVRAVARHDLAEHVLGNE